MDIGLIIDGSASLQAPPGKIPESPPPKEEFEKALQKAKMEETPGEVAETEPNAQLQTLDSEKEETGIKKPVNPVGVPIQIDPSILAKLQFVGIVPILESNQLPIAAPQFQANDKALSLDMPKGTLNSIAEVSLNFTPELKLELFPQTEEADPTVVLDSKSNQTLSALVASTFERNVVASPSLGTLVATPNGSARTFSDPTLPRETESTIKVAQSIPVNEKEILNVTSVQSKVTVPTTETFAPRLIADLPVTQAKAQIVPLTPNAKVANSDTGSETPTGLAVVAVTAEDSASMPDSQTKGSNKEETGSNGQQMASPDLQAKSISTPAVQSGPPTVNSKMTSQERQVMVDTIAKKIDELAIKSVRNEVRVEMHPPELGSVIVNIRKDMAGITATLNASNEPLRQALNESRNDLAGALADRNVGQVRIEVRGANADTMNMGQQYNQPQSQSQSQNHHPRQTETTTTKQPTESKDQVVQPVARRAVTTLLDMEI